MYIWWHSAIWRRNKQSEMLLFEHNSINNRTRKKMLKDDQHHERVTLVIILLSLYLCAIFKRKRTLVIVQHMNNKIRIKILSRKDRNSCSLSVALWFFSDFILPPTFLNSSLIWSRRHVCETDPVKHLLCFQLWFKVESQRALNTLQLSWDGRFNGPKNRPFLSHSVWKTETSVLCLRPCGFFLDFLRLLSISTRPNFLEKPEKPNAAPLKSTACWRPLIWMVTM